MDIFGIILKAFKLKRIRAGIFSNQQYYSSNADITFNAMQTQEKHLRYVDPFVVGVWGRGFQGQSHMWVKWPVDR